MRTVRSLALVLLASTLCGGLHAEEAASAAAYELPGHVKSSAKKAIDDGLRFVRRAWDAEHARKEDPEQLTHWGHPGITAMALMAFYRAPRNYNNEDGPFIREPFRYLTSIQREDGAINDQPGQDNYITSIAMMALKHSGEDVGDILDRAAAYLIDSQLDEKEGYTPEDKFYGGQGYGSSQRPDLSNTQLAVDALHQYGLAADHEYFKRALTFLQRCQNRSESNDLASFKGDDGESYVPGNDGGFVYYPGRTEALEGVVTNADGTRSLRSYGSMTYAGFKSMLHAGLDRDDPRVASALEWISSNYRLDENPGAGQQGLFYYYHTFARALRAAKVDWIEDEEGRRHDWRADLVQALVARQADDGHWVNENPRWWEGNPVLSTIYAVLAIEEVLGR